MTTRQGATTNQGNISLWLPITMLQKLNKLTQTTDITRSQLLRRAIAQYLSNPKTQDKT